MGRSITTRDQSISALGMNFLIAGVIAVAVAFGLGWLLAGMSLRPIHRLTQTAQTIGAERDFSRRVEHTGPDDEAGRLAKTLNAMLSELQAAYQQVEQTLEMQRRFVADVSHELRTPLTTLNGNVELLRREPPISAEDRSEVLSDMASESRRLIRLVNDLLALARADARRPIQCEPILIEPIVEEVYRQARLLAPDREIDYDPLPDVAVLGQADALKQVLLILLDNALKHADGPVAVAGNAMAKRVTVSVRDSGPGIDPELLPSLFERFLRGRSSGDDGIHADVALTINGGALNITQSYEGLESLVITINDGTIHLIASDDGINVSGGNGGTEAGARPMWGGESGEGYLYINGGYVVVDANGDGLDANGPIEMTAGTVIVNGPTNDGNGPLDYLGSFNISGGYLVAVGSSGMAQAPSTTSTQYSVRYNYASQQAAGTMVHIETESGQDVLTFMPTKQYQSVLLSSPELENGSTYVVYSGSGSSGTVSDGLYSGGAYTGGTQVASLTITSMVTSAGSAAGGFRGGPGGRP